MTRSRQLPPRARVHPVLWIGLWLLSLWFTMSLFCSSEPSAELASAIREVAEAAWTLIATMMGALGDGPVFGLNDLTAGPMLLWQAGEFAGPEVKARLWDAADDQADPHWNTERGEFTLGFGLDEPHPRGQLNARAMAGWVCRPGAWSAIFNEPNLDKFAEPTASDVDFPRIALSEARWDGTALHLAAHPQNDVVRDTTTEVTVTGLPSDGTWRLGGQSVDVIDGSTKVALVADDQPVELRPISASGD